MTDNILTRRSLLSKTVVFIFFSSCNFRKTEIKSKQDFQSYLIGQRIDFSDNYTKRNGFAISVFNIEEKKFLNIDIPTDCHSFILHPTDGDTLIGIGQRPSTYSYLISLKQKTVLKQFFSLNDHHFYGHGLFTPDGSSFYCTENSFKTGEGRIILRDSQTLKVLRDFPSYGQGPHELKRIGEQIVVANGGQKTQPDDKETYKDFSNLKPSLAFINEKTQKLDKLFRLKENYMSIRHLDVTSDGFVVLALNQYRPKEKLFAKINVAMIGPNEDKISLPEVPREVIQKMHKKALSVSINPKTHIACATHPEGNSVTFWDLKGKKFLKMLRIESPLGVAYAEELNMFVIGSINRKVNLINATSLTLVNEPESLSKVSGFNGSHIINVKS